jgi:hypothetical protein
MITTQTQPLARCFPFFRSIWQDRAGIFVSIFRPQQSHFFSRLKKVPKKGKHAAMQDFGAGYTCFFVVSFSNRPVSSFDLCPEFLSFVVCGFGGAHIPFGGTGFHDSSATEPCLRSLLLYGR